MSLSEEECRGSSMRSVGLFWECVDDDWAQRSGSSLIQMGHTLRDIAQSFSFNRRIDACEVFLSGEEKATQQQLSDIGFKVIKGNSETCSHERSLMCRILLWLWETEHDRTCAQQPCVIIATQNNSYSAMLHKFRNRSVTVVCISNFVANGKATNEDLRRACSISIELEEVYTRAQRLITHDSAMGLFVKHDIQPLSPTLTHLSGDDSNVNLICECDTSEQILKGRSSVMSPQSVLHSRSAEDAPDIPPPSQGCFRVGDYSPTTVHDQDGDTTLNSILGISSSECTPGHVKISSHTASSRFSNAVYNTLPVVSPDAKEVSAAEQVGFRETTTSSKYIQQSDGEDISREQYSLHEGLVSAIYSYDVKVTVSTLQKIYTKQTRYYRVPAVLAAVLPDTAAMVADGRVDLFNVAVCFLLDVILWCFEIQKSENVESFNYKMNVDIARWILREAVRKGIPTPVTQVIADAVISVVRSILDAFVELDFTWELLITLKIPDPVQRLKPFILAWYTSTDPSVKARVNSFLFKRQEFSSIIPPPQFRHGRNDFVSQSEVHQKDSMGVKVHPAQRKPLCVTEEQLLEGRLLTLLSRSRKGELGSRIPSLYRDEFGECLRLRGRKLKEILLDTGKVKMVGPDGPGDKVFRLIQKYGRSDSSSHLSTHKEECGVSWFNKTSRSEDFLDMSFGVQQDQFVSMNVASQMDDRYNRYHNQQLQSFPLHCGLRSSNRDDSFLAPMLSDTSIQSLCNSIERPDEQQYGAAVSHGGYSDNTSVSQYLSQDQKGDNLSVFSPFNS
mmetsp:Transcript_2487/g.3815  ORF Transcript_2487/g.3815 Transcript_2487/m.3815 type:complete len:787 (-) Transcript_2487:420-2780(-)|eukprot:CAMPEP_0185018232 /NCGR_PEP_ID=MMETSP1103-20130426/1022_1 /TAXON_ID=36769 /ORGANISM="Paraphysomonas bandaiensis, Strain Caron Lab Isolate" /LENGTH=786 /DNA_ID=CAMNT_0027547973 /DNA_START=106 /DNA_END=2466 /DNA_ORIENTATION=+